MGENIFIKSALSSIPLILISQVFFYLTGPSSIPENVLFYIKSLLYVIFFIMAVGLPIYFYYTDMQPNFLRMLQTIIVSWGIFTLSVMVSAFTTYRGLAKDIEPTFFNATLYFLKWFIVGILPIFVICSMVVLAGNWLIGKITSLTKG